MSNEKSSASTFQTGQSVIQRRDQKSLENRGRRLGRPRDFCDLPIRRDEGRVVNTPLVFKRVLFGKKEKKQKKKKGDEREKRGKEERRRERERSPALDGEKGKALPWMEKGDEAHFWSNGYVNKQNCRIWSEANPQVCVETPLHTEKLTVWCALWAGGILLHKR
ncbi:hypothetical protein TNCV_3547691 [Trichonephila clavipes]|nr:hypothetical protein TNCV_3547691 [Trichonephila clavipes]